MKKEEEIVLKITTNDEHEAPIALSCHPSTEYESQKIEKTT